MLIFEYLSQRAILSMLILFMIITGYFHSPGYAQETVNEPTLASKDETDRTFLEWQNQIEKDKLYLYGVKLFKAPIRRRARIENSDGYKYGFFHFYFSEGNEFRIETEPPDITSFRLIAPKGFPNEKEARAVLEECAKDRQWVLNWTKPDILNFGKERIVQYGSPEPGNNNAVTMTYLKGKLVELEYHINL